MKFQQLNTTYVMGPDGKPWATNFSRGGLLSALGLQPFKGQQTLQGGLAGQDTRFNTTYTGGYLGGINTGMRGLEPVNDTRNVPTDVEIGKATDDAIAKAAQQTYTPQSSGYTKRNR